MCGIFGYWSADTRNGLLERMAAAIVHRGPDGEGFFSSDSCHMGIRRLAIIDLETGDQPISNEDQSVWVALNGEIYNYRELRLDLEKRGHRFVTQSDTEVIVHAYEEYSSDFLTHFNGMFGFCLYDKRLRRLLVARDRFGEKPIYYFRSPNIFLFGSEVKCLLECEQVTRRLNYDAIYPYLVLRYVPQPKTLFQDIWKLPAGCYLEVRDNHFAIHRYWDMPLSATALTGVSDYLEAFQDVFQTSVRLRLRSDVPLGAYLSSGVDSTSLVHEMTKNVPETVRTYSIGCGAPGDELEDAAVSATKLGCRHTPVLYTEKSLALLDTILWHLEEPIGDAHIIPTFYLAEAASQELTVVILGEGADETLYGYPFHRLIYRESQLGGPKAMAFVGRLAAVTLGLIPNVLLDKFFPLPTSLGKTGYDRLSAHLRQLGHRSIEDEFVHLTSLFTPESAKTLLAFPVEDDRLFQAPANPEEGLAPSEIAMQQIFLLQMQGWLQDNILLRHDKLAMAHSLETRAPFLDPYLAAFLLHVPMKLKFRRGKDKYILRQYLAGRFDRSIAFRKKTPFFAPVEVFTQSRAFQDLIQEFLDEEAITREEVFNPEAVRKLVHRSGPNDFLTAKQLMGLVIFQMWRKKFRI
ncbi:MAG: asparagine synthase (glutamine-hydrolyzing) [Thermodesulfobacteriota bacterium]